MSQHPRLGVLLSGRGSNFQALVDAVQAGRLAASIVVAIANRPDAAGLARARQAGIEALYLGHRDYPSRDDFDRALAGELRRRSVDLVCLAGFMRRLGPAMLEAYPERILNVHPSLLPSFPGVDAQRQALEYGVKVAGATVHLVTAELDAGPIVLQHAVAVHDDDTVDTLSARILAAEHRIYPEAVALMLDGGWTLDGRRLVRTGARRAE